MTVPPGATTSMPAAVRVVAVDAGAGDLAAVEHLAHEVDDALAGALPPEAAASYLLSSHVLRARDAVRFVAVLSWHGGPTADEATTRLADLPGLRTADLQDAVDEHVTRRAGRLVRYPGQAQVETRTTAAAVVEASCIDAVEGLAGVDVRAESDVDLTGFARPAWRDGRCVLLVQQGRAALVPFEVRDQVACCADH